MSIQTGTTESPLEIALANYRAGLQQQLDVAASDKCAAIELHHSTLEQLQNKTCSYLKLKETKELYQNISQCISLSALKESDLLKASIEEISNGAKNLQGELNKLAKTLKKVKTEISILKKGAIDLESCCITNEDSGKFKEELKINLKEDISGIKTKACEDADFANDTFFAVIKVAGFQGFTSMDGLKNYAQSACTEIVAFNKDIDSNCKMFTTNIESIITSRSELLSKAAINKLAAYDGHCVELALCDTWNTTCEVCSKTPKEANEGLEKLCEKLDTNVDDDLIDKVKKAVPKGFSNKPTF